MELPFAFTLFVTGALAGCQFEFPAGFRCATLDRRRPEAKGTYRECGSAAQAFAADQLNPSARLVHRTPDFDHLASTARR